MGALVVFGCMLIYYLFVGLLWVLKISFATLVFVITFTCKIIKTICEKVADRIKERRRNNDDSHMKAELLWIKEKEIIL